ncbi:hypothetical protein RI103_39550 (plasmid) [Paraburkholderia sp. FT54]|uniref:hypothetical protein n=1 Tax=Paraburkholderia sp. FT54 TaxID=3074437 RepID=UPI00287742C0|nr:hypothetical protein [Paraburkholderia sp. FT54]WNC95556.1 hypothetical protein RI103_39550 [Paraburkholderia sp. FT54]
MQQGTGQCDDGLRNQFGRRTGQPDDGGLVGDRAVEVALLALRKATADERLRYLFG